MHLTSGSNILCGAANVLPTMACVSFTQVHNHVNFLILL